MAFESAVEVAEPGALTKNMLERIFSGRLGAVRIRSFWSTEECAEAQRTVDLSIFEQYDPGLYSSRAFRIGPSLNEHRLSGKVSEHYWKAAEEGWDLWRQRMPLARIHDHFLHRVTVAWKDSVRPAASGGRSAYWGIVRRMAEGTMVHWDDVRTEFPAPVFDDILTGQISANIFLRAPVNGGELLVWSQSRQAADENARIGYGYRREIVPEEPEVCIKPAVGDAIFFSSSHYHAVNEVRQGDRVAFSVFIGECEDGTLVLWS